MEVGQEGCSSPAPTGESRHQGQRDLACSALISSSEKWGANPTHKAIIVWGPRNPSGVQFTAGAQRTFIFLFPFGSQRESA